jgi:hypothetical protein
MTKASLVQWRILLAYYERKASVEAPGKNLECSVFHSYIIRHIAGQRKIMQVAGFYSGLQCNYQSPSVPVQVEASYLCLIITDYQLSLLRKW